MVRSMPRPPPPLSSTASLFLDVDGTLLDIAPTPGAVCVEPALRALLGACAQRLGGALALVSGRTLAQIDALFAPLRLPAAGLHGLERRDAAGQWRSKAPEEPALAGARPRLERFVEAHPGTLLEDKGASLALHVRLAPRFLAPARAAALAELAALGAGFELQEGKCVLEIKPRGADKAGAIAQFLEEPPFAGRLPVFAGDDLTDAAAIRAVAAAGGIAIAVGERIEGPYAFGAPHELRAWLARFLEAPAPAPVDQPTDGPADQPRI